MKRAIHIRKRAIHIRKRAIHIHKHQKRQTNIDLVVWRFWCLWMCMALLRICMALLRICMALFIFNKACLVAWFGRMIVTWSRWPTRCCGRWFAAAFRLVELIFATAIQFGHFGKWGPSLDFVKDFYGNLFFVCVDEINCRGVSDICVQCGTYVCRWNTLHTYVCVDEFNCRGVLKYFIVCLEDSGFPRSAVYFIYSICSVFHLSSICSVFHMSWGLWGVFSICSVFHRAVYFIYLQSYIEKERHMCAVYWKTYVWSVLKDICVQCIERHMCAVYFIYLQSYIRTHMPFFLYSYVTLIV